MLILTFLRHQQRFRQAVIFPFFAHVSWIGMAFLVSSRFSMDVNTTRLELTSLFCIAAFYFLLVNQSRDELARQSFILYSSSSVFVVVLIALVQYIRNLIREGYQFQLSISHIIHSHWTAPSTFTNSAILAGFSLSWALIAWHFRSRRPFYRWLFFGCLAILFFARSWWAFVSLGVGFTYYYSAQAKNAQFPHKTVPKLVGLLTAGILLSTLFFKFGPLRNPQYLPDNRWGWWIAGIRMFLEHPLVGVGLGSYATAFPFFKIPQIQSTLFAHSFIVQLISETGLVGFLSITFFAATYRQRTPSGKAASMECTAYQAALLTILCFSFMTIYLDYFIGKLMVCVIASLSLSSMKWKEQVITTRTLGFAASIILFLFPSWYLPFRASQWNTAGLLYDEKGSWELAESSYQRALSLNPYEDGSCRGLARLYRRRYEQSRSVLDLSTSLMWGREALQLKPTPLSYHEKTN
jgi:O-antigen ligase